MRRLYLVKVHEGLVLVTATNPTDAIEATGKNQGEAVEVSLLSHNSTVLVDVLAIGGPGMMSALAQVISRVAKTAEAHGLDLKNLT